MDYVRSVPYRYTEEQMEQRTMIGDRVFGEVLLLKVDFLNTALVLLCCCLEDEYVCLPVPYHTPPAYHPMWVCTVVQKKLLKVQTTSLAYCFIGCVQKQSQMASSQGLVLLDALATNYMM